MTEINYSDIAPFDGEKFHEHLSALVKEPGFEHAVKWVMPGVDYPSFAQKLLSVRSQDEFQVGIMCPFLETLVAKTSNGLSCEGIENYIPGKAYTLISNHRDIVLDASFLNLCLVRNGLPTCEVAIGNNLLIYPWINDLVRVNGSFIVKRNTGMREALTAARTLSAYIHHAINDKGKSVWIAHREGRAKDSNDRTQESLIKMLGLEGEDDSFIRHIKEVNLMPVAISYEFDPNDYLKAREFLLKKRDPEFKKSQRDDLFSMETGLLQNKGRIHFALTDPLDNLIDARFSDNADRAEVVPAICEMIDNAIHSHYKLFPINYIAYDVLAGKKAFADQYTKEDVESVNSYLDSQLAKVDIEDLTDEEYGYMKRMMLTMYANPLRNKLNI
ncbi:MAG: 1-acyl-sn-glycerol-3-phosphate acyltransferase [Muribaculaceae bacterium]|nr:1-acyl-sn-glycerol-3-phosphate acyltransferase [Muribaculaceae bacterium]